MAHKTYFYLFILFVGIVFLISCDKYESINLKSITVIPDDTVKSDNIEIYDIFLKPILLSKKFTDNYDLFIYALDSNQIGLGDFKRGEVLKIPSGNKSNSGVESFFKGLFGNINNPADLINSRSEFINNWKKSNKKIPPSKYDINRILQNNNNIIYLYITSELKSNSIFLNDVKYNINKNSINNISFITYNEEKVLNIYSNLDSLAMNIYNLSFKENLLQKNIFIIVNSVRIKPNDVPKIPDISLNPDIDKFNINPYIQKQGQDIDPHIRFEGNGVQDSFFIPAKVGPNTTNTIRLILNGKEVGQFIISVKPLVVDIPDIYLDYELQRFDLLTYIKDYYPNVLSNLSFQGEGIENKSFNPAIAGANTKNRISILLDNKLIDQFYVNVKLPPVPQVYIRDSTIFCSSINPNLFRIQFSLTGCFDPDCKDIVIDKNIKIDNSTGFRLTKEDHSLIGMTPNCVHFRIRWDDGINYGDWCEVKKIKVFECIDGIHIGIMDCNL